MLKPLEFVIVTYKPDPETPEHIRIKNGGQFLADRRGNPLQFANRFEAYEHIIDIVTRHNEKYIAKIGARVTMPGHGVYTLGVIDERQPA